MYSKILVPLDGSLTAALALTHARALAQKFDSTIHLVRAIPTLSELAQVAMPTLAAAAFSQDVVSRQEEQSEQVEARSYLADVGKDLQAEGIRVVSTVREGKPARQILEAARSAGVDVIILTAYGAGGAHTRGPQAVYGGVADEVLRDSRIPVLLIRP
jgi:nucleotide-binding universal stress UspA family protein